MQDLQFDSITVDEIDLPVLKEKNIRVAILRLDKIHAVISGNKWFKLKYYLKNAQAKGKKHLVTFGGAYSNHIIATAAAGQLYGFKTTGIIRGEKPAILSHTLSQALDFGMRLFFVNREDYRKKILPPEIKIQMADVYLVNEGGYGMEGAEGAKDILQYFKKENYSHIACAVGTSTMMAGLIKGSLPHQQVLGISVFKNNTGLQHDLIQLLSGDDQNKKYTILHDYHFGGYAKHSPVLIRFMNEFYQSTSVPSDFVYTAKLFYGIMDMVQTNFFAGGSKLLVIHSGGLQGNESLQKGTLIF
jgi:1-aminocyclopropane-1-carboxylate deaminase